MQLVLISDLSSRSRLPSVGVLYILPRPSLIQFYCNHLNLPQLGLLSFRLLFPLQLRDIVPSRQNAN